MTLQMLSVDVLVLQAAREVSYSARIFTHITSAASHILGRPGPGEPSGFLVVPGRAEGVARPAHVANPHPLPAPLPTRPRSLPRRRLDGLEPVRAQGPVQVGGCR